MVQRPSSLRHASHSVSWLLSPRDDSAAAMVSFERLQRGPVGQHRMGGGGHFGGALTFKQHRVGEAFDLRHVNPGRVREFLYRRAGPDAGLDVSGSQTCP